MSSAGPYNGKGCKGGKGKWNYLRHGKGVMVRGGLVENDHPEGAEDIDDIYGVDGEGGGDGGLGSRSIEGKGGSDGGGSRSHASKGKGKSMTEGMSMWADARLAAAQETSRLALELAREALQLVADLRKELRSAQEEFRSQEQILMHALGSR